MKCKKLDTDYMMKDPSLSLNEFIMLNSGSQRLIKVCALPFVLTD